MDIDQLQEQLKSDYKYKIELHAHSSPASGCATAPADVLPRLFKDKGYDAVVLTNHFAYYDDKGDKAVFIEKYLNDYHIARDLGDKIGIKIILGMEICFSEWRNDYLIYGINERDVVDAYDYLYKGYKLFYEEFINEKKLFIQAHPFRDNMKLAELEYIDGIEAFNMHFSHNSRIVIAERFAEEHEGLVTTMGSDFHYEGQEGLSATRMKILPEDSLDIANILRSGDYIYQIGERLMI